MSKFLKLGTSGTLLLCVLVRLPLFLHVLLCREFFSCLCMGGCMRRQGLIPFLLCLCGDRLGYFNAPPVYAPVCFVFSVSRLLRRTTFVLGLAVFWPLVFLCMWICCVCVSDAGAYVHTYAAVDRSLNIISFFPLLFSPFVLINLKPCVLRLFVPPRH